MDVWEEVYRLWDHLCPWHKINTEYEKYSSGFDHKTPLKKYIIELNSTNTKLGVIGWTSFTKQSCES